MLNVYGPLRRGKFDAGVIREHKLDLRGAGRGECYLNLECVAIVGSELCLDQGRLAEHRVARVDHLVKDAADLGRVARSVGRHLERIVGRGLRDRTAGAGGRQGIGRIRDRLSNRHRDLSVGRAEVALDDHPVVTGRGECYRNLECVAIVGSELCLDQGRLAEHRVARVDHLVKDAAALGRVARSVGRHRERIVGRGLHHRTAGACGRQGIGRIRDRFVYD